MTDPSAVQAFRVFGIPAPQGSKSAFVRGGRAVVVDGSSAVGRAKHHAWRQDVADAARKALEARGERFPGLVGLEIAFYLPLPASDPHRTLHGTAPDLDKLVRSVLDALTNAGLILDDSRVCAISARKDYARGVAPGAAILVVDQEHLEARFRAGSKAGAKEQRAKRA